MRRAAPWLLAFAAALLTVPAAGASTVALEQVDYCVDAWSDCRCMDYKRGEVLRYDGEGSERNRVAVRRGGDSLLLRDAGAALRPARGCVALDANTARCDLASLLLVGYRLDGDDGDDGALPGSLGPTSAAGQPRVLVGGAGTDTLADGPDASTLSAGPVRTSCRGVMVTTASSVSERSCPASLPRATTAPSRRGRRRRRHGHRRLPLPRA